MTLYFVPGEGIVDDAERDMPFYGELPMPGGGDPFTWGTPGIERLPEYTLSYQFGAPIQWRPDLGGGTPPGVQETAPGYINQLLQWAEADAAGQLQPFEREQWETLRREALSVPTRDVQGLRFAWEPPEEEGWGQILGVGSPDLGAQLLGMRERLASGTATPHEQALYTELQHVGADWNYRASVPQASDAFNPLGDQLFGALAILGTGATAGLAAAPLVAGGAGLATTLGSLGSLAGTAGGWAGTIGGATGQGWLANIGTALGAVGGIAGGLGGLGNLFSTGITSVADAARVAQAAGRITGGLGKATGADPLKQASSYLGLAGGLGQASGVAGLLGAASGVQQAATSALTEQGGRMADFSYDDFLGWGGDETQQPWYDWATQTSADDPAMAAFLGWGGDETQQPWYDPAQIAGGGGDWLSSVLGGLGSVGRFLGSNASVLGPLVGAGTSLGSGLLGSRASSDAARLQAAALNRGLDLSTAQWLAQEARLAPWAAAGQSALGNLQGMAGQALPQIPGQTPAVSGANYALPGATPGWTPQTYQGPAAIDAGAYRYTPGQGPRAADYRYAPGQIPDADQFRYAPGAVPTLQGRELLANDPGYQFRMDEARRALEASAAARGGLASGATLSALQRQSQDLASQEYGQAWNRAAQQAQLREQWAQQASAQGFGQQLSEAQLREQVNQIATQQGWSQAQAEAQFREQMAQQASQQGFAQALAGQGQQFTQGLQSQQWNQLQQQQYQDALYQRMMEQARLRYGQDVYANETEAQRAQQAYQQQLGQQQLGWNQYATLAGLGNQSLGQLGTQGQAATSQMASLLGQIGQAGAGGALGGAQSWLNALAGANTAAQSGLGGAQFNQQLTSLLAGLNR